MIGGYMGKIMRIDLSMMKISDQRISDEILHQFIGGSGLGAKILYDETSADTDPLSSENLLIMMTGPLTSLTVNSGRHSVITKSPLTGLWAEASVGGSWGNELKRAGIDGMVISGKAEKPVYLWISDNHIEIRDAGHIWGKDTFDVDNILKRETNSKAVTCSIGKAGENLVRFAAIMTDGVDARALGRCGVGAVMGSKNLKAMVVKGSQKPQVFDIEKLNILNKKVTSIARDKSGHLGTYGTSIGVISSEAIGDLPIKNWSLGSWEEKAYKISGQAMAESILTKRYHCKRCVIGCGRVVKVKEGKYAGIEQAGPEYETIGMLGSNLLIDNLEAIQKGNEICNRYGIDTISAGSVIGFAMEAYERGLINKDDTGGIELEWGNGDVMIQLLEEIGEAKGFGKILGAGIIEASKIIGGNSEEFAVHTKGLDLPAHDCRAKNSSAVSYATSNRGACHLQSFSYEFEDGIAAPDLGYPETLDRFETKGKGILCAKLQDVMSLFDSLCVCKFVLFGGISVSDLLEILNAATGFNWNMKEFLQTGERIFNLKRLYNYRLGISRKNDVLPPRMLSHSIPNGGTAGNLPNLEIMLDEYYAYRGWTNDGVPTDAKLKELELKN